MKLAPALALAALLLARQAQATGCGCSSNGGALVNVESCGATAGDGLDDSAAINLALTCASAEQAPIVTFPTGHFLIGSAVTSALDGAELLFAPGAVLDITGSGGLTVSGARSRVQGLSVRLATASTATFSAVTIAGTGTLVDSVRFDAAAALPNATLLQIAGDRAHVGNVQIVGTGQGFLRGVDLRRQDGSEVDSVLVDGIDAALGDSGVEKTYGALLELRSVRSVVRGLAVNAGGRDAFPNGVVIVDGHNNQLESPHIMAPGAKYGVFAKYGAEFFEIVGGLLFGRNNGTYYAGSEGISSGQFAGHLKLIGTAITGWESGLVFHGSHDTPNLYGAVIANNGNAAIVIDSHYADPTYGEGDWPVSGLTISGAYFEEKAHAQEAFIVLKTGAVFGMTVTGSYIGYVSRMLKVYPGFGSNGAIAIQGNRFASMPGGAVVEPNAWSDIVLGNNALSGSNVQSTGTYASKAVVSSDPVLSGLTLGTSGARLTAHTTTVVTANFGNVLTAGTCFELSYTVAGVLSGDTVTVSLAAGLAGKPGLLFFPYISRSNEVTLRACNYSSAAVTSASGAARFDVWKH